MKSATVARFPRQHAALSTSDLIKAQLRIEAMAADDARESIADKADVIERAIYSDPTMRAISASLVAVAEVCEASGNSTAEDFEDGDTAVHNQQRAMLCNVYCAVFYDVRAQHFGAMTPSGRAENIARNNQDTVKEQAAELRKLRGDLPHLQNSLEKRTRERDEEKARVKCLVAEVREHELRWRELEGSSAVRVVPVVVEPNFEGDGD
jgi:hypothetical protein